MVNNTGSEYDRNYEELHLEIERLTRELDQAVSEKIQSAKCGLALLEEKCALQKKCADLEELYENTKHELSITKKALVKLQASQKITTENGIQQEDTLLNESAVMESTLTLQIIELENEIKQVRQELERVTYERDNLIHENGEILKEKSITETEKLKLKGELKELELIGKNLMTNCEELEEENYILQKKLLSIKSSEDEFETKQNELERLVSENLFLTQQLTEIANSKLIAETRLEEALEAFEIEREAKITLKRELDVYYRGSIYKTKSLAESITEVKEFDEFSSNRSRICSETNSQDLSDINCSFLTQVFNELKRLETELEQFEDGNGIKDHSPIANPNKGNEAHNLKSKVSIVAANVGALIQLERCVAAEIASKSKEDQDYGSDKTCESRADLVEIQQGLSSAVRNFMSTLQTEIADIKSKLKSFDLDTEENSHSFSETLENLEEARKGLMCLNKDFIQFSKELFPKIDEPSSFPEDQEYDHESDKNDSLSTVRSNTGNFQDFELIMFSVEVRKYTEIIRDQFKHFQTTVKNAILSGGQTTSNKIYDNTMVQLLKQTKKLESLLSKKRKHIALLQTTIKSNREVAVKALSDIKNKYEKEKTVMKETFSDLVSEVKSLKDEIAGITGLRTIFAERCTEYVGNLNNLKQELEHVQAEKQLLSNILKTAVKQKMDIESRLEEIKTAMKDKTQKKVRFDLPKKSCLKKSS